MRPLSKNRKVAVKQAIEIALSNCQGTSAVDRYLRGIDIEAEDYHPGNSTVHMGEDLVLPFHIDILDDEAKISNLLEGDYSVESIEAFINQIRTRASNVRDWFQAHPEVPLGQRNADKRILMHIIDNAPAILAQEDSDIWAHRLAECHLLFGITEEEIEAELSRQVYRYRAVDGSKV